MNVKIVEQRLSNMWIFGSQLRGEETVDSDIDLLVEFEKPTTGKKIRLRRFFGIAIIDLRGTGTGSIIR